MCCAFLSILIGWYESLTATMNRYELSQPSQSIKTGGTQVNFKRFHARHQFKTGLFPETWPFIYEVECIHFIRMVSKLFHVISNLIHLVTCSKSKQNMLCILFNTDSRIKHTKSNAFKCLALAGVPSQACCFK